MHEKCIRRCVSNIIRKTEALAYIAHLSRACLLDRLQSLVCNIVGAFIFLVCVSMLGMVWMGK